LRRLVSLAGETLKLATLASTAALLRLAGLARRALMRLLSRNCLDEIASSHCLSEGAITLALSGHQTKGHRGIRTLRPAVMCAAQKMLR
jgi:hypothetical protein